MLALIGTFVAGLAVGESHRLSTPRQLPPPGKSIQDWRNKDALTVSAAVRDAARRWQIKANDDLSHRDIQIMQLEDRMCIKFAFNDLSIGGEPVYCYRTVKDSSGYVKETTDLVYDGSNVE
ncbi:hypothetical protein GRI97_16410 [Altererythrobacter xixiisoli]|uniref:Uncharacterized protein n=2 Tax=Croceibacterium xixiisoli TaxID=1476466 RepID=A0A6I4TX48_9SPHN|nr:hypothetical protein [Croceibacterium xixiisoli]